MNRCLWWLTSFSGQTFLALGYLQVLDISDNGRMLEEKGGVARWRCEDTVSFSPISKFIVRKSCGKPDHDHDRCFLMFFGTIFAICYPRRQQSRRKFLTWLPIPSETKVSNLPHFPASPPVTAGCFHLAETANFWRWDFHHLRFKMPSDYLSTRTRGSTEISGECDTADDLS